MIFLVSQPRSGSTLLQMMLNGSPDIATTSEPWIALHPLFGLRERGIDAIYNSSSARNALLDFLVQCGTNISFYRQQISVFLNSCYSLAIDHQGKKYFLDKTPRYYHILDELNGIFPEAKFIILFRNPLAVLYSYLKSWIKKDYAKLCNNYEDLMLAPHKLVDFRDRQKPNCYSLSYETLVKNPKSVLQDLCGFLGAQYSDSMIDYSERLDKNWVFGDQTGIYNASKPNLESLDKWKTGFNGQQTKKLAVSYLESLGQKLVEAMGYDYDNILRSLNPQKDTDDSIFFSWDTIAGVLEEVTNIKHVRRIVFRAITEEHIQNNNIAHANNKKYDKILKHLSKDILYPNINKMKHQFSILERRNKQLQKKIASMQNTLSWKITAPFRNSKILKFIFSKTRDL